MSVPVISFDDFVQEIARGSRQTPLPERLAEAREVGNVLWSKPELLSAIATIERSL